MLTDEQVELHKTHIGGSMIPVIAGLSKRMTARELYEILEGNLPDPGPDQDLAELGHAIEPAAHRWYERATGRRLRQVHQTLYHRDLPWAIAHPDRRVIGEKRLCEFKMRARSDGWGESGSDQVPDDVLAQCQWYMAVMDHQVCDPVVLLHGVQWRRYEVPRDQGIIDSLIALGEDWLRRRREYDPPPLDYEHPTSIDLLRRLYPGTNGQEITLDTHAQELVDMYLSESEERRSCEKVINDIKAQLLDLLGENAIGRLPGGGSVERKLIARKGYTVEPTQYVQLRVRKPQA